MGSWYIFTSSVFLRHYADTPHLVPLPCLPLAALCLIYAHISLTGHSPPHAILPLFSWLTCLRKSIETINTISEDAPKLREIMTEIKKMMPSIKLIMAKVVESLPWLKETHLNFYYVSALRKPKVVEFLPWLKETLLNFHYVYALHKIYALRLIYAHISLTGHSPPHAILPLFSWLTCLRKSIETINAISEDAPKLREIMTEIKKMMPSIKLIMAKVVESLPWLKETHLNFYYVSALRKPKVVEFLPWLKETLLNFHYVYALHKIYALRLIYAHISLTGHSPPHAILPLFSWLTCLRKSIETINAISEDAPKLREIMTEIKKMMPSIKLIMAKVVESLPWLKETHLNFYYVSALRKPKVVEFLPWLKETLLNFHYVYALHKIYALRLIYAHISLTGHSPPHAILPLFSWLTCLRKSIETINAISEDAPKLREIMTEIKKMMPSIKLIMAKVVESLPWLKETHLNFYYVSALRKPKVVEFLPWLKETLLNFYYASTLREPKVNHGFLVPFLRYRHFYDTVSILHIWCHFLTCLIYAIEDASKLREIMAKIKWMMPQIELILAKVNHGFFVIFYVIGISVTLPRCSTSSDTSLLAVDGALPDQCTYFIDWSFIASYYPATARLADLSLKVSGSCQCNFGGCYGVARDRG
ncbi:hypothetical protein ACOSQ2_012888 [Xanthoceras sorbifolium]